MSVCKRVFHVADRLITRAAAIGTVLVLSSACGGSTNEPAPAAFALVVVGTVTDSSGVALGDVRIESEVRWRSCAENEVIGHSSPTLAVSDQTGRFVQRVVALDSAARCLFVYVTRPNGARQLGARVDSGLSFKLLHPDYAPFDSVRVAVTVR